MGVTEEMAEEIDSYTCPTCVHKKKASKKKHHLNESDYERLWDLVCTLEVF